MRRILQLLVCNRAAAHFGRIWQGRRQEKRLEFRARRELFHDVV